MHKQHVQQPKKNVTEVRAAASYYKSIGAGFVTSKNTNRNVVFHVDFRRCRCEEQKSYAPARKMTEFRKRTATPVIKKISDFRVYRNRNTRTFVVYNLLCKYFFSFFIFIIYISYINDRRYTAVQ